MRNITFTADDTLIDQARNLARNQGVSLNDAFRLWLRRYVAENSSGDKQQQMRALLDQITEGVQAAPDLSLHRQPENEREQRMLARFGGV